MGAIAVSLGNSARDVVLSRDLERALQISRDDVDPRRRVMAASG
jgi:hypothetical protein